MSKFQIFGRQAVMAIKKTELTNKNFYIVTVY